MREARVLALAAIATRLILGGASGGCGGPAKAGGKGADCFRVSDCQGGLVCIEHKCSDDLSSIDIHQDAAVGRGGSGGAAIDDGGAAGASGAGAAGAAGGGQAGTGDGSAE
jgi:hypothetical protein